MRDCVPACLCDTDMCVCVTCSYLLAVGLESGDVLVYKSSKMCASGLQWELVCQSDKKSCHTSAVKRLKWNPNPDKKLLASCSTDHTVKIFNLVL